MQVFLAGVVGLLGVVCIIAGVKSNGSALFAALTGLGTTPAPAAPAAGTGGVATGAAAAAGGIPKTVARGAAAAAAVTIGGTR